jgi:GNAT superfamily N-acetyltransferase
VTRLADTPQWIRAATVQDASAIGDIKVRAWRTAYAGYLPAPLLEALDPATEAADWAEYLAAMPPEHRLWVVGESSTLLGYCRTGPADGDPDLGHAASEVYGLYIDPRRTGTGLGRRLFRRAVADLEGRGHQPICVYAYLPNAVAVRFYERAGFIADGTIRLDEQDGTGVPEVRLVRR